MIALVLLAVSALPPALGLANEYCSSFAGTGTCPPCRSSLDQCRPWDSYWSNTDLCVLDDDPDVALCGPSQTVSLVQASNRTNVAGSVVLFQSADDKLWITFKMNCPFVLRPGAFADVPYSAGVYIWNTSEWANQLQYQFPDTFSTQTGTYTCISFSVNLKRVCNPIRSSFTTSPKALSNNGCGCFTDTKPCPPADLSLTSLVVVQPRAYAPTANQQCATGASKSESFVAKTDDGTGWIKWDANICGLTGAPLAPSTYAHKPPAGDPAAKDATLPSSPLRFSPPPPPAARPVSTAPPPPPPLIRDTPVAAGASPPPPPATSQPPTGGSAPVPSDIKGARPPAPLDALAPPPKSSGGTSSSSSFFSGPGLGIVAGAVAAGVVVSAVLSLVVLRARRRGGAAAAAAYRGGSLDDGHSAAGDVPPIARGSGSERSLTTFSFGLPQFTDPERGSGACEPAHEAQAGTGPGVDGVMQPHQLASGSAMAPAALAGRGSSMLGGAAAHGQGGPARSGSSQVGSSAGEGEGDPAAPSPSSNNGSLLVLSPRVYMELDNDARRGRPTSSSRPGSASSALPNNGLAASPTPVAALELHVHPSLSLPPPMPMPPAPHARPQQQQQQGTAGMRPPAAATRRVSGTTTAAAVPSLADLRSSGGGAPGGVPSELQPPPQMLQAVASIDDARPMTLSGRSSLATLPSAGSSALQAHGSFNSGAAALQGPPQQQHSHSQPWQQLQQQAAVRRSGTYSAGGAQFPGGLPAAAAHGLQQQGSHSSSEGGAPAPLPPRASPGSASAGGPPHYAPALAAAGHHPQHSMPFPGGLPPASRPPPLSPIASFRDEAAGGPSLPGHGSSFAMSAWNLDDDTDGDTPVHAACSAVWPLEGPLLLSHSSVAGAMGPLGPGSGSGGLRASGSSSCGGASICTVGSIGAASTSPVQASRQFNPEAFSAAGASAAGPSPFAGVAQVPSSPIAAGPCAQVQQHAEGPSPARKPMGGAHGTAHRQANPPHVRASYSVGGAPPPLPRPPVQQQDHHHHQSAGGSGRSLTASLSCNAGSRTVSMPMAGGPSACSAGGSPPLGSLPHMQRAAAQQVQQLRRSASSLSSGGGGAPAPPSGETSPAGRSRAHSPCASPPLRADAEARAQQLLQQAAAAAAGPVGIPAIELYCSTFDAMSGGSHLEGSDAANALGGEGGRKGLMRCYNAVSSLEPGSIFLDKYKIKGFSPVMGRHSVVLLAKNIYSRHRVAIKFHADPEQYAREKAALRMLSPSYVAALLEPLEGPAMERLGLPPALVLEAGRATLTDWLRDMKPDPMAQKMALHQVLAALVHMHSHKLVHRDLKPSNIMWFEDGHRFKLIDLAEAAPAGGLAPPSCTPLYSPPEQLRALLGPMATAGGSGGAPPAAGLESPAPVVAACAADMWSYGVLAFEVLTGQRFYGPNPCMQEVLEAAFGHRALPTEGEDSVLASLELSQARRLITNLIVRDPAQRWSALTCHRNAIFQSGDDTDQKRVKWGSVLQMSRVAEMRQLALPKPTPVDGSGSAHAAEALAAALAQAHVAVSFTICDSTPVPAPEQSRGGSNLPYSYSQHHLGSSSGSSSVASSRRRSVHKEVPLVEDDALPGAPVFMLLLRKTYQLRVSLAHSRGLDALAIEGVECVRVTAPDGTTQVLPLRPDGSGAGSSSPAPPSSPHRGGSPLASGGGGSAGGAAQVAAGAVAAGEWVGDWDPAASRSKHLQLTAATDAAAGPRRTVPVTAELEVRLTGFSEVLRVSAVLHVVMERQSQTLSRYKATGLSKPRSWTPDARFLGLPPHAVPQWVREAARGATVLVRAVQLAEAQQPQQAQRLAAVADAAGAAVLPLAPSAGSGNSSCASGSAAGHGREELPSVSSCADGASSASSLVAGGQPADDEEPRSSDPGQGGAQ